LYGRWIDVMLGVQSGHPFGFLVASDKMLRVGIFRVEFVA